MFYRCVGCGLVYYFDAPPTRLHCRCGSIESEQIHFTARSYEYSAAGGEVTGIETTIDTDAVKFS